MGRGVEKEMTIKQGGTLAGAITAVVVVNGLQITLLHLAPIIPVTLLFVWTLISGIGIGQRLHKWRRDKEMAGLVAERLLGKPSGGTSSDMQAMTGQQANSMSQQVNAGLLNSLPSGSGSGSGQLGRPPMSYRIPGEKGSN